MDFEKIMEIVKEKGIEWVEVHFTSLLGRLHSITFPSTRLSNEVTIKGFGKLDGSSIKGFSTIDESDLVLKPDPETFAIIPWKNSTARFIGNVYWGFSKGRLEKDPRYIAERAEKYAKEQGYISLWGPEVEFFIFDKVELDFENPGVKQSLTVISRERSSLSNPLFIRVKEGYYVPDPYDAVYTVRNEASTILTKYFNVEVEAHHHEVASSGQCEIDFKYGSLVRTADNVQTLKYVVRSVAAKYGMYASFMPKPIHGDSGSGMHVHVSLWDTNGRNLFYDENDDYAELSQLGRYFIGGLIEHGRSLSAIVSPTTNSYKRLIPGYEAPVYLAWSKGNRSAAIRVPVYHRGVRGAKRIEYRPPDPSANPYLAFAAILAAGLDGIKRKIDPGDPIDKNIYHMSEEERRKLGIKELPRTLWEALDELESDREYLCPIFPKAVVDEYIELKRREVKFIDSFPTPVEFYMYMDV